LLAQPNVKPTDVDSGFEVNGWYLYGNTSVVTNWAGTVPYVVALGDIEGFEPVATKRPSNTGCRRMKARSLY
jgi:hypothetical protein